MILVEKDSYVVAIHHNHGNQTPERMLVGRMVLAGLPVFSDEPGQRHGGSAR
jgi:hypothetical protein